MKCTPYQYPVNSGVIFQNAGGIMSASNQTSLSFSDWPGVLEEHLYETYNEEKYSDLVFICR